MAGITREFRIKISLEIQSVPEIRNQCTFIKNELTIQKSKDSSSKIMNSEQSME